MTVRWLVTGAGGMVGRNLCDALSERGEDLVALTKSDLDITDARVVDAIVREVHPTIIVNCAAYTKVDRAEEEIDRANILQPTNIMCGRPVVWSHPAFANRSAYARNDKEIVCVSLAAE